MMEIGDVFHHFLFEGFPNSSAVFSFVLNKKLKMSEGTRDNLSGW